MSFFNLHMHNGVPSIDALGGDNKLCDIFIKKKLALMEKKYNDSHIDLFRRVVNIQLRVIQNIICLS